MANPKLDFRQGQDFHLDEEGADRKSRKRRRLRVVIPAYPAFNVYSRIARTTTALGPVSVASAVHEMEGWDVEVIDENNYQRSAPRNELGLPDHETLQKLRPADVVGFYGGLTSTILRVYDLARFYREKGVPTLAGGQHFVEENIEEALHNGIDVVVMGEAEETIKELLYAFEGRLPREDIKGIAYLNNAQVIQTQERELLTDFDHLPLPDFSLVRYAKIRLFPVGRVRGCGMDCEFCTVKGKPRYATPERLLAQITSLFETFGAKHFFIVDDLFGQDRLETLRFCRLLHDYQIGIKKRFELTVQIRLDKAKDMEMLRAMRDAGVDVVAIGFESPIPEELKAMEKHLKPEDMISLSRVFYQAGFLIHGMFIFGYPFEKDVLIRIPAQERVRHFRRFIKKAKIDTVQVLLPVPIPGTKLTQRLKQENRLFPKESLGWEYYDGNFPLFIPDEPMTPEEMQQSIQVIMRKFYGFRHMFQVGLNILSFPVVFLYLHNIRRGLWKWYRGWRNNLRRFGGWVILRGWLAKLRRDNFFDKLGEAKRKLAQTSRPGLRS
jgi:radical SAM superfamily enzyme YgiQ (UPF0313 family)